LRRRHPELDEVVVDVVHEPEWRPDFVTDAGLMQMRHPVRPGTAEDGEPLNEESVCESLKLVLDPEVGINIVDLGLIYGVAVEGRAVHIEMTLTTPGCPLHATIEQAVRRVLDTRHPDIVDVQLELIWDPAWDVDKITPAGRAELGW
jgi:metal-sulfur cluster biosynthetic enzyme